MRTERWTVDLVEELSKWPVQASRPFDDAEYRRRMAATRARMTAVGVDVLVVSNTSNIAYLTGYDTTMPSAYSVLIVPESGEPTFHCAEVEASGMLYSGNVSQVVAFEWRINQDIATDLARLLADGGYSGRAIGLEMGYPETFAIGAFDAKSYVTLTRLLPDSSFVDATLLVLDVRLIKTDEELEYMRQAGRYTWAGQQAALATLREGVSDNEVMAAAYAAMIRSGSELMSIDPMIMSGPRVGWMCHLPFKRDHIGAGDPVYLEMSGCHNRYNAPCIRTAVVGKPSAGMQRLGEVSAAALETLLQEIRPGRTCHDVAREVRKVLDDKAYHHGTYGYSIGMGFQPSWCENPCYIADGQERELEVGMTFHLGAGVYWHPGRPIGGGLTESAVVTRTGCECLTPHVAPELVSVPAS